MSLKNLVSSFAVLLLTPAALSLMELSCSSSLVLMVSSSLELVSTSLACSETEGKNGEAWAKAGGGGTWRRKHSERARVQARSAAEKQFSVSARCSLSVFPQAYGVLEGKGHGVLPVRSLRCLRRLLFTFLRPKHFSSRLNAFCSALFGLAVSYAN